MTSIREQFGRDEWTRFTPKQKLTRWGILVGCALAIVWALSSIRVVWAWVWGVMLNPHTDPGEIAALDSVILSDNPDEYDQCEGFLLIGADGWSVARQTLLEASVRRRPRPVFVGNPDLVAPRETGLSQEPGWFAHRLADATGIEPIFLGKPFPDIFDLALSRFQHPPAAGRVLMVGDTLHTDILGGNQAGFATVLVTAHGSLAGLDVTDAIRRSAIVPDFVVDQI